jgi:hypothetical protein
VSSILQQSNAGARSPISRRPPRVSFLTPLHAQLTIRQRWTSIAHAETGDASRVCCMSSAADAAAADDAMQLLRTLCTGTYHVPADRSIRPYMVASAVTQLAQNADGSSKIAVQVTKYDRTDMMERLQKRLLLTTCAGLDPWARVAGQQPRSLCRSRCIPTALRSSTSRPLPNVSGCCCGFKCCCHGCTH